ncbi:MAG: NAD(P)H-dependent oxidoreductase subunit E, partial [Desulfobacteraceae bacterium]|nr:NAD(P)H-dependent oxidoreductase subunit E [Desulfobacteraceae bacterium]
FSRTFVHLQEILGNLGVECGGVNYLGDINNSQGACDMGFLPAFLPGYQMVEDEAARKPFEEAWGAELPYKPGLTFRQMVKNMGGAPAEGEKGIRLLYCVGENLAIARPAMPDITKALESVDFLVVQDILNNETLDYADVVLPAAAWSEETGTYTNCERRISLMRRAVSSPGEAKPEVWIFTQLANRLGLHWENETNQSIWENEIIKIVPFLREITYDRLEHGGTRWALPDPATLGITDFADVKSPLRRPGWTSFNYHHRTLLEQCEGLLESIPHTKWMVDYEPPGDPEEVRGKFIQLLEEEEKPEAKEAIDKILDAYKDHMGGLIPVLQQVQGILGFLPIPVQHYIALGMGMPSSDVFGVVSFYSFFTMVPRGRHIIRVCLGTACFVKGSGKLLDILTRHLKVDVGETTDDKEYSLEVVRCIGACGLAPVMVVDEETHGMVDPSEIVQIVESVRGKE